ncbi:MAG: VOC family protein [Calditrichaeota bacterium]|nr:VOC family protein [Calditrichota bacterium]HQU70870.1 VOC family protein [Calditrichia bacterium]
MSYKPDHYPSLSVYIMAQGAQKLVDFLRKAFDAREIRRYEHADGTIMHTEVRLDDSVVMISEAGGDYPAFPVWLHLYVPDVDASYQKALGAGAQSVQVPVQKEGDPDRRGGVLDPCGNTWWLSTQQNA